MKIVQLSDVHIPPWETTRFGVSIRNHFIKTLDAIVARGDDQLILTGDLAYRHGDVRAYRWLKDKLDQCGLPYIVIPGNHDKRQQVADIFGMQDKWRHGKIYFKEVMDGLHSFFLDTADSSLDKRQRDWLVRETAKLSKAAALFIHHPLSLCDCSYMDRKHPLKNTGEALTMLEGCPNIKWVFCGHYHTDKEVSLKHAVQYLTPSTWYQIGTEKSTFEVSGRLPGFREISWNPLNLSLKTRAIYLS